MTEFFSSKRYEVILAALTTFALPLLDAIQSGAFHSKSIEEAIVVGALILLRAAASHRQSPPPPTEPTGTAG